ncbi:conserved hypothetical protein [Verticillium alfalfae VaMs.102]|uniref:Uncharacterized protein n=1 Tax=Verticillium alfalfae (strain VaMs.102 / ATCC MYA-4576 / FGSC 10136) TaxID=526221 RepID=C9SUP4_VERA1|nr:conserved hypothetical protein [Verticillium alfalfae VaMs.102]EEY22154.1 conserved hypothetical protein [Verticillium alfalfae VaMs.102]
MAIEDSAPVAASEQQPTTTTSQPTAETQSLPIRSQEKTASGDFDIVAEYHSHLRDHEFTKPVAAIEALVALLAASSYTTVFETLETVKRHSETLRASVKNPVPLQAGTDLFLQYLVSSLKQQEARRQRPAAAPPTTRASRMCSATSSATAASSPTAPSPPKDLGYDQTVLDFQTDRKSDVPVDAVDYTPPEYITNLVTENGPKLPGYVLEQLLEIYGALNG